MTAQDLNVTPEALQVFRDADMEPTDGVRIGVMGGGCSGLQYALDIVESASPTDHVFDIDGIRFFVDPKSAGFLKGLKLGYVNTLMRQGFTFENPSATKTCGCGKSFCG